MLEIIGIETNKGYFIADKQDAYSSYARQSKLLGLLINGVPPKPSFEKGWMLADQKPSTIEKVVKGSNINPRYILKDVSLANEKIPLVIPRDVACTWDENEGFVWNTEYAHLASLYSYTYDTLPDTIEQVEFTFESILSVDDLGKKVELDWVTKNGNKVSSDTVEYRLLDKIAFPKIYYQEKCEVRLSSKVLYDIIREHVKKHIDNKVAYINSDYDFCFEVKKRIKRLEPLITRLEIKKSNGRSYAQPRFETKTSLYASDFIALEMTNEEHKHKNYTILPFIDAPNLEALKDKVDTLLTTIMLDINTPASICPHCQGDGVTGGKQIINIASYLTK